MLVLREVVDFGVTQLVRLPELMQEPEHLARVAHVVGGKLQSDHSIDVREFRQANGEDVLENPLGRTPDERDAYDLGAVPELLELGREPVGQQLGPSAHEGHLVVNDGDLHASSRSTT